MELCDEDPEITCPHSSAEDSLQELQVEQRDCSQDQQEEHRDRSQEQPEEHMDSSLEPAEQRDSSQKQEEEQRDSSQEQEEQRDSTQEQEEQRDSAQEQDDEQILSLSKEQRKKTCKQSDCPYCTTPPCGVCVPCTYPAKKQRCLDRWVPVPDNM